MDGMEHHIGDAEQLLAPRGNGQCHVTGCVAKRCEGADTGHNFRFMVNEVELALDWWEVVVCERVEEFFGVFINLQFR
ncbi:MAG: hypothetical protein IBX41_05895 [Methanophagales archaeon]|nr:hypothetical protein [Methanophagales archaeon]